MKKIDVLFGLVVIVCFSLLFYLSNKVADERSVLLEVLTAKVDMIANDVDVLTSKGNVGVVCLPRIIGEEGTGLVVGISCESDIIDFAVDMSIGTGETGTGEASIQPTEIGTGIMYVEDVTKTGNVEFMTEGNILTGN